MEDQLGLTENDRSTELYRILLSGIEERVEGRSVKSIAFTSAVKGEGKTTTAINVAKTAAMDFGKRVLLLEADLKNPKFHYYWTKPDGIGLYQVLTEQTPVELAIGPTGQEGLEILPVGSILRKEHAGGTVLISGLSRVIQTVSERYDYVFVDSPPILPLVDTRIISAAVDGLVVVVRADCAPRSIVAKVMESLPKEKVLGVVFNGVKMAWPLYSEGYIY